MGNTRVSNERFEYFKVDTIWWGAILPPDPERFPGRNVYFDIGNEERCARNIYISNLWICDGGGFRTVVSGLPPTELYHLTPWGFVSGFVDDAIDTAINNLPASAQSLSGLTDTQNTAWTSGAIVGYDGVQFLEVFGVTPAAHSLDSHSDVGTMSPVSGQMLGYDGTNWVNVEGLTEQDAAATYVPLTRILTAGAGLTGGGDLSTDRTFDVGAGFGVLVSASDVAIDPATVHLSGVAVPFSVVDLTDTSIVGLVSGQSLSYDGTNWVNSDGGLSEAEANILYQLSGVPVPFALVDLTDTSIIGVLSGQQLGYDGTNWVNTNHGLTEAEANVLYAFSGVPIPFAVEDLTNFNVTATSGDLIIYNGSEWIAISSGFIGGTGGGGGASFSGILVGMSGIDKCEDITCLEIENATVHCLGDGKAIVNCFTIGEPEDGDYTDGLFTDFTSGTKVGTAIDRFNEVLNSLAPPPAPTLDDIDNDFNGVNGDMSMDDSNPIAGHTYFDVSGIGALSEVNVDQAFNDSGDRAGIVSTTQVNANDWTGTLNEDVAADTGSPNPSYPANAFGNGDQGNLILEVNGVDVHTVDLTTDGGGSDVNGNGSGFSALSAATNAQFPNGNTFDVFKYRTGTYVVSSGDMRLGWNYARVRHEIGATINTTNYVDCFWDADNNSTSFSAISFSSLSMTGSKHLTGVEYHTDGTIQFNCTYDNAYRNSYDNSSSAVNFSRSQTANASTGGQALDNPSDESLPTCGGDELQQNVIAKAMTFANSSRRLIDGTITANVQILRTVNSDDTSSNASQAGLLLDNYASNSTRTFEDFQDEDWRMHDNSNFDSTTHTTGNWDSTIQISGLDATGNNVSGLQVIDDDLTWPRNTDFSAITNGPAGNPDYSVSFVQNFGERTYYRLWDNSTDPSTGNFRIVFQGTGTFIAEATSFTNNSNQIKVSIKAPSQSGWMDAYTDFSTGQTSDGDGARATTFGTGRAMNTNWGLTIGTLSTSATGETMMIRITVAPGWTGELTSMTWTFNPS